MKKEGSKYKILMLCIFFGFWIWSSWNPVSPEGWLNENYLLFVAVPVAIFLVKYFKMSNLSVTFMTAFLCLHTIAAHHGGYTNVPFGFTIQNFLGIASRNMYDRFMHFMFGLLIFYPLREVFMKISSAKGFWTYYVPVDLVLSFSAFFEILELLVVLLINPSYELAFMGFQNDPWDATKDIFNAFAGSLLAAFILFIFNIFTIKGTEKEIRKSFIIKNTKSPKEEVNIKKFLKKAGRNVK